MHNETGKALAIRFALPSEALRPFVTTYYWTEIGIDEDDPLIEDRYHPEWGNLRFIRSNICRAAHPGEEWTNVPQFCVSGPSSLATAFQVGRGTTWGIGLMPLGWAKFIGGAADDYADRYVDGAADPAFLAFHGLADKLLAGEGSFAAELKLIEEHMAGLLDREVPNETAITAINAELVDPELGTVVELAERVNMTVRSLERLSRRAFGFPPKLLLRRQRFLRSLAQFMLDPSLKWLSALDYQYHDQAHFVRDFKRFMGMSPSAYAKLDKPLLVAAAQARMEIAGQAVQGLHAPTSTGAKQRD